VFSIKVRFRQNDRKTERQKDRKTERQKDRKTERQKDRKTERQKDRKIERQKDRKTGIQFSSVYLSVPTIQYYPIKVITVNVINR
jgi:hypothetical protein